MGQGGCAVSGDLRLHWTSPGPVADGYLACNAFVVLIIGPVGSGKTSMSFRKLIQFGARQRPSPRDGIRRTRWCTLRRTYREVWSTTLPTWHKWVPRSFGEFIGGKGEPASHRLLVDLPDRTQAHMEFDFMALGDHNIEDLLRGYEPTGFLLNEFDLFNRDVYHYCLTRAGRYPPDDDGGPTWSGLLGDMNAPDEDSYAFDLVYGDRPPDQPVSVFIQPSGLSPHAENLANLPAGYYERMRQTLPDWMFRRMVENKPGMSRAGDPVYPQWNDPLFTSPVPLQPVRGIPLTIGLDAGGTPAATVWQRLPNGQWLGLAELVAPETEVMGPTRFGELLLQLLTTRFPGFKAHGWADPSAAYGADRKAGEADWIQIVANVTGLRVRAAPTNVQSLREEALRKVMRLIEGHTYGILIDPSMRIFRRGMVSGYRLMRINTGTGRRAEVPEKNHYSHVVESGQYAVLGGGDYAELMGRQRDRQAERGAQGNRAILDDGDEVAWAPVAKPGRLGPRVTVGGPEPWDDEAEL
jgi:hypothetical protein